jgi:hypothetical protein
LGKFDVGLFDVGLFDLGLLDLGLFDSGEGRRERSVGREGSATISPAAPTSEEKSPSPSFLWRMAAAIIAQP